MPRLPVVLSLLVLACSGSGDADFSLVADDYAFMNLRGSVMENVKTGEDFYKLMMATLSYPVQEPEILSIAAGPDVGALRGPSTEQRQAIVAKADVDLQRIRQANVVVVPTTTKTDKTYKVAASVVGGLATTMEFNLHQHVHRWRPPQATVEIRIPAPRGAFGDIYHFVYIGNDPTALDVVDYASCMKQIGGAAYCKARFLD